MSSIVTVFGFSWPYIRRYWGRLVVSLLFGLIFALSNASFIWASRTLTARFYAIPAPVLKADQPESRIVPERLLQWRRQLSDFGRRMEQTINPWLPRFGQPMDWRQVLGGLLFR